MHTGPGVNGDGHARLADSAQERLDEAVEGLSKLSERVETFVRERPGTAILCALGAGFLIGRLVRR